MSKWQCEIKSLKWAVEHTSEGIIRLAEFSADFTAELSADMLAELCSKCERT